MNDPFSGFAAELINDANGDKSFAEKIPLVAQKLRSFILHQTGKDVDEHGINIVISRLALIDGDMRQVQTLIEAITHRPSPDLIVGVQYPLQKLQTDISMFLKELNAL